MYRFPRPPEQERRVRSLPDTLLSKLFDKNGIISRDIGVCAKHWPPDCVKRPVQGDSLRPVEPPSIFGMTAPLYFAQSIVSSDRCADAPLPLNPERKLANHEIKLLVGTSL